jgi:hypothetical protein
MVFTGFTVLTAAIVCGMMESSYACNQALAKAGINPYVQ